VIKKGPHVSRGLHQDTSYYHSACMGDLLKFKLRAERRAGEFLKSGEGRQKPGEYQKLPRETLCLTLSQLGISNKESHQRQKLAAGIRNKGNRYWPGGVPNRNGTGVPRYLSP
jgi:hypothetical protein